MDNEYFMSINDVSKRLSVPAHTLRYWEKQFPNAIKPTTGSGGRRYYRQDTFDKLVVIKDLLYVRGMTIAGVKKLLHDGEFPDVNSVSESISAPVESVQNNTVDIDSVIALLKHAKDKLLNS
ncbi:MAG: MerR family transcriptional regulator [Alphaproteobacteria bacterium]|nr:MerR family transcriptional regulator [Alphaproteobacteria bacterium]